VFRAIQERTGSAAGDTRFAADHSESVALAQLTAVVYFV
jgi:hypothetical protein